MKMTIKLLVVAGFLLGSILSSPAFNLAAWPGPDASQWAPPLGITNIVGVSAGNGYSMALRANGTVVRWTGPYFNDMGVTNIVKIASGWCSDLALRADGTVLEWGVNPPNCGSTAPGATSMPAGLTNIVAVAEGAEHGIVLKSDGTCVSALPSERRRR